MRFAGAAGSKPLTALPRFGSVPGRLESGRGEPGAGQEGEMPPGEQGAPGQRRKLPSLLRGMFRKFPKWCWPRGVPTRVFPCWDGLWLVQQPVPLSSTSHPNLCGLDKVSMEKKRVSQSRTPFPGAEHSCPAWDLPGQLSGEAGAVGRIY